MTRTAIPLLFLLFLAACAPVVTPTPAATLAPTEEPAALELHDITIAVERDSDVPDLPFEDNPDPLQCGIPTPWGGTNNRAYLTGIYEGELIQPTVFLYDSHLRKSIAAQAPHGSAVEIVLFQVNPALNYYLVNVLDDDGAKIGEGWIPEPFLSFDPVT